MTPADTADIVRRIVTTWPMAPKGVIWTEAIEGLEYAPCLAAYTQLRDELDETRLSVARFRMAVRGIEAGAGRRTSRRHPSEPEDGPLMAYTDYIALQTWKAGTGDQAAQDALAEWETAQDLLDRLGLRK